MMASYVSPELREKFETLSIDLKNNILKRNVKLNSIYDLINILEVISKEAKEWIFCLIYLLWKDTYLKTSPEEKRLIGRLSIKSIVAYYKCRNNIKR